MKQLIAKGFFVLLLTMVTVTAWGACFRGWFLPEPLKQPVSLRDGSAKAATRGYGLYWLGGRSHYGGGYRGGK